MDSISRNTELDSPLSFKRPHRRLSTYSEWRLGSLAFALIAEAVVLSLFRDNLKLAWALTVLLATGLAAPALVLAVLSARQFGRREASRQAWLLVAPQGLADCALFLAYSGLLTLAPGTSSAAIQRAAMWVLAAVTLNLVARAVLAFVFWKGMQIYRGIGLRVQLHARDYAAIAVLIILLAGSVVFEKDLMRVRLAAVAAAAPDMLGWFHAAEYGWLIALGFCSVFGVMVWRLQSEMGGGLVAKAWRGVLLYAATMLLQFCYKAFSAFLIAHGLLTNPGIISAQTLVGVWGLLLSEYMLLLGTSYQYEACAGAVEFNLEDLKAIDSAQPGG